MARSNAQFWRLMVAGLADSHSKSQAREAGGGSIVKAMGSRDLRQIDPPGSWPSWLSIVLMSLGWGAAWAIGLMAVNNVAPLTGWVTLGAIGGLVTARVLHSSHPSLSVTRLIMVIVGWVGAGLCSASVTNYDVVTGWVSMGILGGGVTGLAAARRKSSQMFLPDIRSDGRMGNCGRYWSPNSIDWRKASRLLHRHSRWRPRGPIYRMGRSLGYWGLRYRRPRWCLDVLAICHGKEPRRARYD